MRAVYHTSECFNIIHLPLTYCFCVFSSGAVSDINKQNKKQLKVTWWIHPLWHCTNLFTWFNRYLCRIYRLVFLDRRIFYFIRFNKNSVTQNNDTSFVAIHLLSLTDMISRFLSIKETNDWIWNILCEVCRGETVRHFTWKFELNFAHPTFLSNFCSSTYEKWIVGCWMKHLFVTSFEPFMVNKNSTLTNDHASNTRHQKPMLIEQHL